MKISPDRTHQVYRAMRSLFRYSLFMDKSYPDVMVEQEESILSDSFKELSAQEIYYVVTKWPEFSKQQSVEHELENDRLFSLLERDINSLN